MYSIGDKNSDCPVTELNKREYVQGVCRLRMVQVKEQQLKAFMDGFFEIIP